MNNRRLSMMRLLDDITNAFKPEGFLRLEAFINMDSQSEKLCFLVFSYELSVGALLLSNYIRITNIHIKLSNNARRSLSSAKPLIITLPSGAIRTSKRFGMFVSSSDK